MSYNSYKIVASYSVCIWKSILLIEQIFISELEGILNFILDCHKHIIVWYIQPYILPLLDLLHGNHLLYTLIVYLHVPKTSFQMNETEIKIKI